MERGRVESRWFLYLFWFLVVALVDGTASSEMTPTRQRQDLWSSSSCWSTPTTTTTHAVKRSGFKEIRRNRGHSLFTVRQRPTEDLRDVRLLSSVLRQRSNLPVSRKALYTDDIVEVKRKESSDGGPSHGWWPPWPFSLVSARSVSAQGRQSDKDGEVSSADEYRTGLSLLWAFTKQSTRIGFKQMQQFGSQMWFHMPPAAPPLIFLASIPRRTLLEPDPSQVMPTTETLVRTTLVPLWSNAFVRNLALSGVGLAILSWAHSEVHRKRCMTPLPLRIKQQTGTTGIMTSLDIARANLPPFLPEQEDFYYYPEDVSVLSEKDGNDKPTTEEADEDSQSTPSLHHSLRKTMKEWNYMRRRKKFQRQSARRLEVMEQLVAIQRRKKKSRRHKIRRWIISRPPSDTARGGGGEDEMGYALVTGASRGIGRAIACELARWEVPLILVARDGDKLTALARELEACYGVECCVLQADLTKPGVPESVYRTIESAGLTVDILVNNAGISSQGLAVDIPLQRVTQMLRLNVDAVSSLTHLFGKEMKRRRRGRILMVTSMCGAVAGVPSVAVYAATKAFEKTLAISMAKEMEQYGVGVTCLVPGAVEGTDFRETSDSQEALCWKLPFYSKSAEHVAKMGVRAMLRGETEVTPGWINRVFLKGLTPIIPQRVSIGLVELAWNPFHIPFTKPKDGSVVSEPILDEELNRRYDAAASVRPHYHIKTNPRILDLDKEVPNEESLDVIVEEAPPEILVEVEPDEDIDDVEFEDIEIDDIELVPEETDDFEDDSLSDSGEDNPTDLNPPSSAIVPLSPLERLDSLPEIPKHTVPDP